MRKISDSYPPGVKKLFNEHDVWVAGYLDRVQAEVIPQIPPPVQDQMLRFLWDYQRLHESLICKYETIEEIYRENKKLTSHLSEMIHKVFLKDFS